MTLEAVLAGLNGEAVTELLRGKQHCFDTCLWLVSYLILFIYIYITFDLHVHILFWLIFGMFGRRFFGVNLTWKAKCMPRCAYVESKVTELPYFASKAPSQFTSFIAIRCNKPFLQSFCSTVCCSFWWPRWPSASKALRQFILLETWTNMNLDRRLMTSWFMKCSQMF